MSVASPPRRQAPPPVVNPFPIRYPDSSSRQVMTRRAWWLVVLNVLVPGSAQALAGNKRLGRVGLGATLLMWALIVGAALLGMLWRSAFLNIATNWFALLAAQVLLLVYAVLWVVLTIDTVRLVRLVKIRPWARLAVGVVAATVLVLASGGAVYASNVAGSARAALGSVFTQTGPAIPPDDGYYNILLLGGDSGDGRDSVRYDSISVVSVNAETGAVTIFGIPRDMPGVPFSPGPMHDLYPDGLEAHDDETCGWGNGINQLTNAVEVCRADGGDSLYPDARKNGSEPAVEATKDAAEGVLGISIPFYAFLDMNGFAALIDALGGVDINVVERLPKGGPHYDGQPVDDWAFGWIEPGQQHMDGDTAQWYARSRYTTSDFDRMRRQRELQEAIFAQFTPQNVLARFQDVAAAGTHIVRTDVPQSMLGYFVDLALKGKGQPVTAIDLTPANGVDEFHPDWDGVHGLVQSTLHPPSPTPDAG